MGIDPSLTYKIKSAHSGKCIYSHDYFGHYDCNPDDDSQKFKFESIDGGYKIKGVKSGKCIYSNSDGKFYHGACADYADQKFGLENLDGQYKYKIYGIHSNKCIYSTDHFGVYDCLGQGNIEWNVVPIEFDCCFANVERKGANTSIAGLQCESKYTDPGGTACTNFYADYCKVGNRIITDSKCKALEGSNITLFNQLMKDKCDLDEFYQTTECINWCKNNSTHCNKLNTVQSCKEFGIPTGECTVQKVLDVKTECQKYGIRSEQGLAISQCSPASIKALTDQCKEYKISDSCSPGALQDAIDNATQAAQLELIVQKKEQEQENYNTTQKTIADILNLTEEPIPTATPETTLPDQNIFDNIQQSIKDFDINNIQQWIKDNSTMFMIIIVIMLLIIFSSSSVSALLVLK